MNTTMDSAGKISHETKATRGSSFSCSFATAIPSPTLSLSQPLYLKDYLQSSFFFRGLLLLLLSIPLNQDDNDLCYSVKPRKEVCTCPIQGSRKSVGKINHLNNDQHPNNNHHKDHDDNDN